MTALLEQIEQRRVELGITKRALAKRAGIANSTVQRLLNARDNACGWSTLTRLADAVGLSVELDEVDA